MFGSDSKIVKITLKHAFYRLKPILLILSDQFEYMYTYTHTHTYKIKF